MFPAHFFVEGSPVSRARGGSRGHPPPPLRPGLPEGRGGERVRPPRRLLELRDDVCPPNTGARATPIISFSPFLIYIWNRRAGSHNLDSRPGFRPSSRKQHFRRLSSVHTWFNQSTPIGDACSALLLDLRLCPTHESAFPPRVCFPQ